LQKCNMTATSSRAHVVDRSHTIVDRSQADQRKRDKMQKDNGGALRSRAGTEPLSSLLRGSRRLSAIPVLFQGEKVMADGLTGGEGVAGPEMPIRHSVANVYFDTEDEAQSINMCLKCKTSFTGPAASCPNCRKHRDAALSVAGSEFSHEDGSKVSILHKGGPIGPYNQLLEFITHARNHAWINDEDTELLQEAVKDIQSGGISARGININQKMFQGDEEKAQLLNSHFGMNIKANTPEKKEEITGISCPCGATFFRDGITFCMTCGSQESLVLSRFEAPGPSPTFFSEDAGENTKFLRDFGANVVDVGKDIKGDVGMLMTCFKEPFDVQMRHHIKTSALSSWMEAIARMYNIVPYHSWRHAYDVLQWCYMYVTMGKAGLYLHSRDILSLYIAALAHDVAHPGVTNNFLISTRNDLALRYNDISPLENMHAHVCFITMRRKGHNFLESLSSESALHVRKQVIDAILATDMKDHYVLVKQLEVATEIEGDSIDEKKDRRLMVQGVTHMADLAQCCRPWDVHKYITAGLEQEQFFQGDIEREMGRPVTPLMDRNKDSMAGVQKWFMEVMVMPLVDPFEKLIEKEVFDQTKSSLQANAKTWAAFIAKHGKISCKAVLEVEDAERIAAEDAEKNGTAVLPEIEPAS